MLFNSLTFLAFIAIVLPLYFVLSHKKQNLMLLVASYIFYGAWDIRFLYLIILSTAIDYTAGLMIEKGHLTIKERIVPPLSLLITGSIFLLPSWDKIQDSGNGIMHSILRQIDITSPEAIGFAISLLLFVLFTFSYKYLETLKIEVRKKLFLTISVLANLGILAVFKYFNFFIGSASDLLGIFGLSSLESFRLDIILPVGISFYTFQTMSYSLDIYNGKMKPETNYLDFALFVSYFPQLVAGPVERASALIPRIAKKRTVDFDMVNRGIYLILLGFMKKVAIADGVAPRVDMVFAQTTGVSALDILSGVMLFSIQIYCDFSGYSDIARGISKILGIDLILNFNVPYFAKSPGEFWKRWHISLSSWLRDYLYIPLGGNRGTPFRTKVNLFLTMVLGGLWHGAAWNFVLWGFFHGTILTIDHSIMRSRHRNNNSSLIKNVISIVLFYGVTCYGWLLFRAGSIGQVIDFTAGLFSLRGGGYNVSAIPLASIMGLVLLFFVDATHYIKGTARWYQNLPMPAQGLLQALFIIAILMGLGNSQGQFIYFQF